MHTGSASGHGACGGVAGLTLHTQDIHIVSVLTFDDCGDTGAGAGAPITSAVIDVDYVTPASWLVAPPVTATTVEIEWSRGQQSTADGSATLDVVTT